MTSKKKLFIKEPDSKRRIQKCSRDTGQGCISGFDPAQMSEIEWCRQLLNCSVDGVLDISCFNCPVSPSAVECLGGIHALHFFYLIANGVKRIRLRQNCAGCDLFEKGINRLCSQLHSFGNLCKNAVGCDVEILISEDCVELKVNRFPVKTRDMVFNETAALSDRKVLFETLISCVDFMDVSQVKKDRNMPV